MQQLLPETERDASLGSEAVHRVKKYFDICVTRENQILDRRSLYCLYVRFVYHFLSKGNFHTHSLGQAMREWYAISLYVSEDRDMHETFTFLGFISQEELNVDISKVQRTLFTSPILATLQKSTNKLRHRIVQHCHVRWFR